MAFFNNLTLFIQNNETNLATTNNTSYEQNQSLSKTFHFIRFLLSYLIYPFIIATGSTLNILTIIIFLKRELCHLNISIYTISLAIADLCVLLFPVTLNWLYDMSPNMKFFQSKFWCYTHGYIDMAFCCCSSWNVVAISYERWIAVCKPMDKTSIFSNKRAFINIISILFFSFILHSWYPFLLKSYMAYNTHFERYEANCDVIHSDLFRIFGTLSILSIYVIPFILISVLNGMIVRKICRRIKKRKTLFGSKKTNDSREYVNTRDFVCGFFCFSKCSSINNNNNNNNNEIDENLNGSFNESIELQSTTFISRMNSTCQPPRKNSKIIRRGTLQNTLRRASRNSKDNDFAINTMLIAISITFLILIFPYQLLWFYKEVFESKISEKEELIITILSDITLAIRNLNFAINFIFYSTLSNQFRRELILLFDCTKYMPNRYSSPVSQALETF